MQAIRFTDPGALRREFEARGLLARAAIHRK